MRDDEQLDTFDWSFSAARARRAQALAIKEMMGTLAAKFAPTRGSAAGRPATRAMDLLGAFTMAEAGKRQRVAPR